MMHPLLIYTELFQFLLSIATTIGFVVGVYVLFGFKASKLLFFDLIIVFLIHLLFIVTSLFLFYQELILFVVAVFIVTVIHKTHICSALMFGFVSFFKIIISYPLDSLLHSISNYMDTHYVFEFGKNVQVLVFVLSVVLPMFIYILGAYLLRRSYDVKRSRLYSVNTLFAVLIIIISVFVVEVQRYVLTVFVVDYSLVRQAEVTLELFIGLVSFPFVMLYVLKSIHIADLHNELLEEELLSVSDTRMLAYRYTHNLNSIILTMNILASKRDCEEMIQYLDNIKL